MDKQKEIGSITLEGLNPEEIESQRKRILKMRSEAEQIVTELKSFKTEKQDAIGDDDNALNSSLDATNGPVRKKQLFNAERTIINCNNALSRIQNGTYGICFETGESIPKEMLKANPFRTRKTIE